MTSRHTGLPARRGNRSPAGSRSRARLLLGCRVTGLGSRRSPVSLSPLPVPGRQALGILPSCPPAPPLCPPRVLPPTCLPHPQPRARLVLVTCDHFSGCQAGCLVLEGQLGDLAAHLCPRTTAQRAGLLWGRRGVSCGASGPRCLGTQREEGRPCPGRCPPSGPALKPPLHRAQCPLLGPRWAGWCWPPCLLSDSPSWGHASRGLDTHLQRPSCLPHSDLSAAPRPPGCR